MGQLGKGLTTKVTSRLVTRFLPVALVASLNVVAPVQGLGSQGPSPAQADDPTISAELVVPTTTFTVTIPGRDPSTLTYRWRDKLSCGRFFANSPQTHQARWKHPQGNPPKKCPHEGADHEGTVKVTVRGAEGLVAKCKYSGSLPGSLPCTVPPPKIAIVSPLEGGVINGGTIITTNVAPGTNIKKVSFTYTPEGGSAQPINGPAPDLFGGPSILWNTIDLSSGSYLLTVNLNFNVNGQVQVANDEVMVHVNEPPLALATADEVSRSGSDTNVRFDAAGSFDNDGTIVRYQWDFGDGTKGEGKLIEHTYMQPGTYPVTLTVTDNEGATSTGSLSLEIAEQAASGTTLTQNVACGCREMQIKVAGNVEGPEGYGYGGGGQWGFPEGEQGQVGPYNDGTDNQLDMSKDEFAVHCRFQVIAELYEMSAPHLCTEGQMVKRTVHYSGADEPKRGRVTSDPRYDTSSDPDDPYSPNDNAAGFEVANCSFRGKRFCDDDYHGGGAGDGSGSEGIQPPNPFKLHEGQSRVLWLDAPGFGTLQRSSLRPDGASYLGKFKATVGGSLGTCECSWTVRIRISRTGEILENQIVNVDCKTS